jgi:POT family proton-dependent oligopeptide transporter
VFYYTRFFADAEGLTSLNVFFGVFSDYLWSYPYHHRLVYYDEVIAKRLSGMMMGMWF